MEIKHKFVSNKVDSADATIVRPSNWNDDHEIKLNNYLTDINTVGWWECDEITDGAIIEDTTTNSYDLENNGMQEKSVNSLFGYGIRADGITDNCRRSLIASPNIMITQNITIEAFFYPEDQAKIGAAVYWGCMDNTQSMGWQLYSQNGIMYWQIVTGDGLFTCSVSHASIGFVNNKIYHIRTVYGYSNSQIEIWIQNITDDGTLIRVANIAATGTITYNIGLYDWFTLFANNAGASTHLKGTLDQVSISNVIRTENYYTGQNIIPEIDAVTNLGSRLRRFDSIHAKNVITDSLEGDIGINHTDLNDMPSASNSDHDGRYYTESEVDTLLAAQDEFTELTDTPNSYSGQAGNYPKVNTAQNALEFSSSVIEMETTSRSIYVDADTGSDSNNGTSWGQAFLTMQKGIDDILPFIDAGVNITVWCRGEFSEGDEEGAICDVSKTCIGNGNIFIKADDYKGLTAPTSATSTTLVFAGTYDADFWKDCYVWIYSGNGQGEAKQITGSSSSGGLTTLTVSAWSVTPNTGSRFCLAGRARFTQPGSAPNWKSIQGHGAGLRLFCYGLAAFDYDVGEPIPFYCYDYAYMSCSQCIGFSNGSGNTADFYSTNYASINAVSCASHSSGGTGFQAFRFSKINVNSCIAVDAGSANVSINQMSYCFNFRTYHEGSVNSVELNQSAGDIRDTYGTDGSSYGVVIDQFSAIREIGSAALSVNKLLDLTEYNLLPLRTSTSAQPTPETEELRIWRDPDDNKTYIIYNDPDEGVRKVELT